jgi:APA family basic amino acid/polyamine antiporter
MDPGLTAALGIGGAQYLLAAIGAPTTLLVPAAIALIIGFGALTLVGVHASGQVLRWTALAKLVAVGTLVLAAIWRSGAMRPATAGPTPLDPGMLAPAVIAAFFAFGGWWDLGRMAEDIESPSRTMPRALLGGVAVVAVTYALASVALVLAAPAGPVPSDAELVNLLGAALFGAAASHTLAAIVVIAVAGSLAAVLLGAPRVYLAMTRDHLFPSRLVRFDETRGTMAGATLIQVVIACVLVIVGSFDAILGYFVPGAVFFLGLSAAAVLVLPRPRPDDRVFRAPMHPLPLLLFLVLIVGMLALFIAGQPRETLLGGAVIALGIPASYLFIGHRQRRE